MAKNGGRNILLYCVFVFILTQALLQPMCVGIADVPNEVVGAEFEAVGSEFVDWVYGNVRGLRQGCGDLQKAIATQRLTFFAVNETHLDGDPAKPLIPRGYKVLCRLDRNSHGRGLLLGCKKHILADKLGIAKYNVKSKAELVGINWGGVHRILYYTPNSTTAPSLLEAVQQYKEDHSG